MLPSTVGRQRVFLFSPAESHAHSPGLRRQGLHSCRRSHSGPPGCCLLYVWLVSFSPTRGAQGTDPCSTSSVPAAFPAWPQFVGLTALPLPLWDLRLCRECCLFPPLLNQVGGLPPGIHPLCCVVCGLREQATAGEGAFLELLEEQVSQEGGKAGAGGLVSTGPFTFITDSQRASTQPVSRVLRVRQ